jgi:phospho-N-acetylmuramoyl-pentapeptide-transferase
LWTPLLTNVLYKYKLGKNIRSDGSHAPIFSKMHKHKQGTPTMGGMLIWVTTLAAAVICAILPVLFPSLIPQQLNFITREETLLPLGALVASALVGLADDLIDILRADKGKGGMPMRIRFSIYSALSIAVAYWFVFKLDWTFVHIPLTGNIELSAGLALALFFFVIVATAFSVNETDGLDGLAGGVLLSAFLSFAAVAFLQERYELGVLCAVIAGALLAFLWFNIHPARFFMGDTGSMSLGVTLAIVAIYTNTVWLLPIIGSIFVIESASVLIQWTSKGLRKGKKVFRSTPIHHHFEAIGWPEPKIVMRFWIIAALGCAFGLVLYLIDRSVFGLL